MVPVRSLVAAACGVLLAAAPPARATLRVVASIPILGSFAKEIGGDRISVESLGKGYQDPHFIEPRPNLLEVLNRADLLLVVGLDLEVGWLPPLVAGSHNPRIQDGEKGSLDCSRAVALVHVPADPSMGDVHPVGNPHYWIPPANATIIAREIADRLAELDPAGRPAYEANLAAFSAGVDAKEKELAPLIARLRGVKIATYHKSWTYVSAWLGMREVGYLEPQPGIPPGESHLSRLIGVMRSQGASLLVMEDFYNRATAQLVAEKAGARLVVVPADLESRRRIRTWFDLVDVVVRELAGARN